MILKPSLHCLMVQISFFCMLTWSKWATKSLKDIHHSPSFSKFRPSASWMIKQWIYFLRFLFQFFDCLVCVSFMREQVFRCKERFLWPVARKSLHRNDDFPFKGTVRRFYTVGPRNRLHAPEYGLPGALFIFLIPATACGPFWTDQWHNSQSSKKL